MDLTVDEFTVAAKKVFYQKNWKALPTKFWLKFIISMRNDMGYNPEEFDYIFVEMLKNLVGKKFSKILEYFIKVVRIQNCKKDLTNLSNWLKGCAEDERLDFEVILKTLFGENFEEISPSWLSQCYDVHRNLVEKIITCLRSDTNDETQFTLPKCWKQPSQEAKPFEVFLRARWGDDLLKLLDCTKEELCWWRSPAGIPRKLPPLRFITKDESTKKSSTDAPTYVRPYHTVVPIWLRVFVDYPLVSYNATYTAKDEKEFFVVMKSNKVTGLIWDILELSIPPVLAPSHYRCKISGSNHLRTLHNRYLYVNPWFVSWITAFGLEFMQLIQNMFLEYKKEGLYSLEDGVTLEKRMLDGRSVLQSALARDAAPNPKNFDDTPHSCNEFLLEPYLIIQLPWTPALLLQWLSCALLEVMKFELESLELRHWPMPSEVVQEATKMLTLVRRGKERILLGLCILNKQTMTYPQTHQELPDIILDEVITPTMALLEYLLKGMAYSQLKQVKIYCWNTSHTVTSSNNFKNVPSSAYTVNKNIMKVYINHPWHIKYWIHTDGSNELESPPFGKEKEKQLDIVNLISLLNQDKPQEPTNFTVQKLSFEEEIMYKAFENIVNQILATSTNDEKCSLIINNTTMFVPHMKPKKIELQNISNAEPLSTSSYNIRKHVPSIQALYFAYFGNAFNKRMKGMEKNPSPLSCLVRFSGEILVKEQQLRLGVALTFLTKQTPIASVLKVSSIRNISDINFSTNALLEAMKNRDRSWLQLQFEKGQREDLPAAYLHCVSNIEDPYDAVNEINNLLKVFIYNIAFINFEMWEKGKEDFTRFHIIQYILPCFLSLLDVKENDASYIFDDDCTKFKMFSTFIVKLIEMYMFSFEKWRHESGKRENAGNSLVPFQHLEDDMKGFRASKRSVNLYLEIIYFFANTVELKEEIKMLCDSFMGWPITADIKRAKLTKMESLTYTAWRLQGFSQIRTMIGSCEMALGLPNPTDLPASKTKFQNLYIASYAIARLTLITVDVINEHPEVKNLKEYELLIRMSNILPAWRRELLIRILRESAEKRMLVSEMYNRLPHTPLEQFIENGYDLMSKILGLIRRTRDFLANAETFAIHHTFECTFIKCVIHQFCMGNMDKVTKLLKLKTCCKGHQQAEIDMNDMALKYLNLQLNDALDLKVKKKRKEKKKADESEKAGTSALNCRNCHKIQQVGENYVVCDKCIEEKYPDVNHFCSTGCKDAWWKEEHMAEHLEYELGLSPLCQESK